MSTTNMHTIKVYELGNGIIGMSIFNQYNQQYKGVRGKKINKKLLLERLRKPLMRQGLSVFVKDETIK